MWKALIKLVEKWSYRCKHNWVVERNTEIFHSPDNKMPKRIETIYRCTKCCEFKRYSVK